MDILTRHTQNPILIPDPNTPWESYATFNGTAIKDGGVYHLLYRAMSDEVLHHGKKLRISSIGHAKSTDCIQFGSRKQLIAPDREWDIFGCEDPRITKMDDLFFIFYTALSGYPPHHQNIKCAVAISSNLETIYEKHLITPFNAKGMTMFPEKINGKYTLLLTVNTDKPPARIAIAQFEKLETIWDADFWHTWYEDLDDHILILRRGSSDQVEIGAPPIHTPYGWILIHSYIKNYFYPQKQFRIEAVMLDLENPRKIIGRIKTPCLIPKESYELKGQIDEIVFPEGALIDEGELKVFYGGADSYCCLASSPVESLLKQIETNTPSPIRCQRFPTNPLMEPIPEQEFENKAVFNPAAIDIEGKVYIVYRTFSKSDVSSLGLAISYDGICIDERLDTPIYTPHHELEVSQNSKGSYGIEDPRITRTDDTLYMCYTAFDGILPRLALTSIFVQDFLNREWSKWAHPIIISPPGIADKDGCLFPEKINGKYAFFHRIEPTINIDFVDDLSFSTKKYLDRNITIHPRSKTWDDLKIGINTPPIKTDAGWLVFYHGISRIDNHYRLGALLLDLKDISIVLSRTEYPILEPELYYEREGVVANVVFPCGAVVRNGDILLYYGGADKVVCGAKIQKEKLLDYLTKSMHKKFLI